MNYLSDDERQLLLNLIDLRIIHIEARMESDRIARLTVLRRKLEGVDKRVAVEETS
jgi:hypothetical protein